ncbi:MAG: hypothetical protein JWM68_508 [Verrucomicrobiales bacterium]|nr:hypothetical protein [Verrucomicrobiales bacterium]
MSTPGKVFQIGFNRCGTLSLHTLFETNNYASIHWENGRLAQRIQENFDSRQPLLTGYEKFVFYCDMERLTSARWISIYITHFKELDRQYPGSRFILNTRNVEHWIASRLSHVDYAKRFCQCIEGDQNELVQLWRRHWQQHHANVLKHFAGRPNSLLVFDIDTDSISKIKGFLPEFTFSNTALPHQNRRSSKSDKS